MLRRTLAAIGEQAHDGSIREAIVVDDGSSDGTGEWLAQYRSDPPFRVVFHAMPENRGPARARNAGIRSASGDVVLFLGDDTVPAPGLFGRHASWHGDRQDEGAALLGRVTWPPEIEASPFMRWLEEGGQSYYFNYSALRRDGPIPGSYFYTCNVSVKRCLLLRTSLFDESFLFASHEDLELGHRLEKAGMNLWYDAEALAWHWHPLDLQAMCRRVYRMGYSAPWYWARAGDAAPAWRRACRRALAAACSTGVSRRIRDGLCRSAGARGMPSPLRWHAALGLSFWGGMSDNLRGLAPAP